MCLGLSLALTRYKTLGHMFLKPKDCQLWGPNKKVAYCVSWSGTGTHKIQNLGPYVPEAQGSRTHEGEWPNKPGSEYQTWHNTLTPY